MTGAVRTLNIDHLRAETPGCKNVIHLNHAGSSLMPRPVIDATIGHIQLEAEIGGYEAADQAAQRVDAVYDSIAALIGAKTNEIAVVENATRAWDMAFYGIDFTPGDRILTTVSEYGSNVIAFLQIRDRGVSVEVVPNDEHGQISISALTEMMDDRVKVVAVSHMPTNGGLVQPTAEIGAVIRGSNALYILDACQTIGQMPVDVEAIGCDVLSATSRKYLRGPRGMGFLYVRESALPRLTPPMLDIHAATWVGRDRIEIRSDARKFENWECNYAAKLGMGAAIDYARDRGLDAIWERIQPIAAGLRADLSAIPGVMVTDLGAVQGGIVTFTVAGKNADDVCDAIKAANINVTSSSVFSTRYDMEARGLAKVVRASVHYLTTPAECAALLNVVASF
jgi:cysteine desulfurase/selenocysteine lyase